MSAIYWVNQIVQSGRTHLNIATRSPSKGVGVKSGAKPISVLLPDELDSYVRNKPNRSEWLRQVIAEAIEKEISAQSQKLEFRLGSKKRLSNAELKRNRVQI
ncbi:hypothetical protein [Nostoc sp. CCY0012]|uniref:hypothetical protein n=1 Tax=Nostoc sp. CCY0012 TaxID=1056123 RepID=UPI0039C65DF8